MTGYGVCENAARKTAGTSVAYLVSFQGSGILGCHSSLCSIATRLHALQHCGLDLHSCQTLLGAPLSFRMRM